MGVPCTNQSISSLSSRTRPRPTVWCLLDIIFMYLVRWLFHTVRSIRCLYSLLGSFLHPPSRYVFLLRLQNSTEVSRNASSVLCAAQHLVCWHAQSTFGILFNLF